MKRLACAAASAVAMAAGAHGAIAASGNLDGWGRLHFGMTVAKVLEIAGPTAQSEDTFLSGPVVVWRTTANGERVQIAAFVPDGKVHTIKIYLPDIHHETEPQCYARLEAVTGDLAKQYGSPDEITENHGATDQETAWHAIFKFKNGATITADADLHDVDFTCTADLIYDSHQ